MTLLDAARVFWAAEYLTGWVPGYGEPLTPPEVTEAADGSLVFAESVLNMMGFDTLMPRSVVTYDPAGLGVFRVVTDWPSDVSSAVLTSPDLPTLREAVAWAYSAGV